MYIYIYIYIYIYVRTADAAEAEPPVALLLPVLNKYVLFRRQLHSPNCRQHDSAIMAVIENDPAALLLPVLLTLCYTL